METRKIFNEILTGRKFKAPGGVIYQKTNLKLAKAIQKVDGTNITDGLSTSVFYNSKIIMTVLN
jgi:hypothetical protein